MSEFSDKTVLVYDQGYFQELAIRLARDFKRVLYFKPWKKACPQFRSLVVGDGFEEIERVKNVFDVLPEVDLCVFPYVYDGDLQLHMESMGMRVWGSRKAEEFEFRRGLFKRTLEQVGLPVSEYETIVGMDKLWDHFQKHPEPQAVKVDLCRGDGETWIWDNPIIGEAILREMDSYYGEAGKFMRFIVEQKIESIVEPGYDGITVDGQFTDGLIDYEIKNKLTASAFSKYDALNEHVRLVNEKFGPKLAERRCRSMWGTEILVGEDSLPYFIDATCRMPSPPGETMLEMFSNLSEIIWHGANGDLVQPEPVKPFAVQIGLFANWEDLSLLPVVVPDKVKQWIKLGACFKSDGAYYMIQNEGEERIPWLREGIGMAVGLGDTLEEAYQQARAHADEVEGANIEVSDWEMAEAIERIQAGKKEGVDFPGKVPDRAIVLEEA